MLIVAGTFQLDPADRDAFIASRHDGMRNSRAEAGCLEYTFSADPIEPGRVLLYERWDNQEALDAHLAGMRSAPSAPAGPTPKGASITIYDISGERQMGGR